MEFSWMDIGNLLSNNAVLITGLATVGLVVALIIQTDILAKQTRLASGPAIFPRFVNEAAPSTFRRIFLYNVGKGNAVDIYLQFKDIHGIVIGRQIEAYVLLSIETKIFNPQLGAEFPENIDTGIRFDEPQFEFKIEGWYRDTNGKKINATRYYEFPPRIGRRWKLRFLGL